MAVDNVDKFSGIPTFPHFRILLFLLFLFKLFIMKKLKIKMNSFR